MKQNNRRGLSLLLVFCLLLSLFPDWLPAAAATQTPHLLADGIVFDNNACPWGSEMTKTSFTLNIRTTSDPTGNAYQWQYSADGKTAWTNVVGETAAQFHVAEPVDGRWYRCVVTNGGQSAESKPVEAVRLSTTGDVHGRIWTNTQSSMSGRWFLSNGKMAYTCNLHSPVSVYQQYGMSFGDGGKFHVFGEYLNPDDGKTYMLQTSYGIGGWQIYSSKDTNPDPIKFGMFFEDNYHLDECQFMFRDEYPYKVYIGPNMEDGYHSLCIWTDSQLGSKTLFGDYSDYAALQTILRKDGSPLQISLVAAESLSVASEDTASMVVNTEDIDASTNFRFYVGNRRYVKAFSHNIEASVAQGLTTGKVVANNQTFENVVLNVEGIDSGMSLSWIDHSDKETIWFSIGAGSIHDAEIVTEPEPEEPQIGLAPWKSLQATIDAGISKIQLVKPGETSKSGYTAVYTNEKGVVPAESDDKYLHIAAEKNITIDLNGNTIHRNLSVSTQDGNAVTVEGTLTLEDSAGGGMIRGGNNYATGATGGGVLVSSDGAFTMNGGAISGNQGYYGGGVYVEDGGKFTMNGGTISGNNAAYGGGVSNNGTFQFSGGAVKNNSAIVGGGVFNNESGVTEMSGGEISGNAVDGDGGGVANYNKFTMSGGAITGNFATNGGGVANIDMGDENAFTVTGGKISGNEAEDYGGGVMLYDGIFALSGAPDISGNTAGQAGKGFYLSEDAVITVSGALSLTTPVGVATEATPTAKAPVLITDELQGNGASSDFASENPDYEVQLNNDGEAVLAIPSPELTQAPAAKTLTYNGAAQELITAGTASKGTLMYRLGDSGTYSATIPVATNAGAYTVYYKVAGENGAADTPEKSLPVNIAPKPLTNSMVTLAGASKVYNGEKQTPGVTVKDGSTALSADADYTVSGDTGTDAGSYTAVVTGRGNYTGTVEKAWAVTPAAIAPTVTLADWTYGDDANKPDVKGNAGNGAALIEYSADNKTYSSLAPTDAGNYVVRVQIAVTKNYLAGEAEASFTIKKRPATVTASNQSVLKGGAIEQGVSRAALSGNVSGHTLSAVTLTSSSTAASTDSGTITPSAAKIVRGGTDVTANYDISYVDGRLTVDMPTFPVTFYSDSAGTTVDQKHDAVSGSSLSGYASLTLENSPLRTFAGWSLEKGVTEYYGNESKIIDWAAFVMPEAPVSVYPVWVENQLTILLDLNAVDEHNKESWYDAAKFDAASPASMDAAQARQLWMKIGDRLDMSRMNAATRTGYMLNGWRTKSGMFWDASWKIDPEYCDRDANGAPILQYASEYRGWYYTITLTAQWTPEPKKSSVMYDLNGGTGNIVDNTTYVVNDLLTVTTEEPTPPDGKRFAGWLDKAGNLYQPGDTGTYESEDWLSVQNGEEALWMTAYYEDIPEPDYSTITFKTGGGTKVSSITLQPGEAVTTPDNPTRIGYTFAGWSPAVPDTMPDDDLTVTAQWTPNRYTITFDTGRGSAVTPITQDFGTHIDAPASPVLTGYTFAGWDSELPATMPAHDMTLSAVWTINSYTLTFDTDGGSELPPRTGIYGASVVLPDPPVKDGFVFDGWDKEIPSTVPAVHMTVKALWTPLPAKLDVTAADYSGVYDGKPHSITVSAPEGAAVTYSDAENGTYGATNPTRKDAGEYTIYYQVTADGAEPFAGSAKITIAQKDITISGIKALNKEYDGNTDAKLDYDGVTFGGLVDGDKLRVTAKGAFADAQPGTGKTVAVSGLTLDGDSVKNYRLADAGQQTQTTADIIAPAPELSTTIYAVKQDADGSWKSGNAAPLETSDKSAYTISELYKDGHFHITAYSVGAYADGSGRVAVSAGQSVALDSANGKLYLYFARDAFDLTFYADTHGTKVLKTEKVLYGAPLDSYGGLKLDDTELATFAGWSTEKGVTVYNDGKGNTAPEIDFNGRTMSAAPLYAYPMFITNYINVRLDLGADDAAMDASQGRSFWKAADAGILVNMSRMNAATRPDYALDGWYTKDGTRWDSAYAISKEYCDRDADGNVTVGYDEPYRNHIYTLTLTAKWKLDLSASVEYDLNGGTGDIKDTTAYPFNSFVTVSGTAPTPPQNQIFAGWLDSAGTLHNPGDSFPFANKALRTVKDGKNVITLTARYVTPKDVMITFDTDGGTAIAPITEDAGEAISAPAEPVKTGYTFVGWDKSFPSTMPTSNLTLKAKWEVNTYTLTFDTGRGTPIAPLTLDYGAAVKVANPSLTGYDFAGWEPELPETMPPQNLTLKAKWTPRSYTITFNTDGGSTVQPVTDIYGAWIPAPDAPVKDGYVFQGWKPELPETMPAENITVKAIWKQAEQTITFDTDGGTEITPISGVPGSPVTPPANPTKPGYVFVNWKPELPSTIPTESITVKAIWKLAEHTIIFDTDGGTEITPISGVPGSPVTPPANPTKPGYVFVNWTPELPSTIPTESITVKAIWKLAENTIVFDTDGGTEITPISGVPGSPVTTPDNPTKPGYVFQGWKPELPATIPTESITVKAIWKLAEHTIIFDTDGGTEITPISGVPGSPVTAPDNPTKDGYVFTGWDMEIPASIPAEDITITAQWVPLSSTLDVKSRSWDGLYDGQSHSITVTAPEDAAVTYSESRDGTYSANNPAYRDAGQYRVYYRVSKDGTESVNGSSTVHISRKEVTVSGIAARNKPYDGNTLATLYYDGVTFAGLLPGDTLTVTADGAFTDPEPGDGKTVLISGLTLGGSSAGNYRLAETGQQSATTANITAKTPDNRPGAKVYAVRQNADGSWDNNPTLLEELVFGALSYLAAERYAAEGFYMVSYSLGAYADEAGRTAASAGENVPLSGDNQDLYLYYARQTFELVFYSDSDGKTVAKTYRVAYGAALSGYAGETLPERQDYTFAGWASAPNQTSYANKNGVVNETVIDWGAETMPAETKHVYPVWVHDRLNIRLDLGGLDAENNNEWYNPDAYDASTPASMDAEQVRDFDVDLGELIRMGAMNAATRVGYTLEGWYTQDGVKWNAEWGLDPEYCTKDANGEYDKYKNDTRRYSVYAVILTARWKPIEIGVVYDTNGGSGTVTDGASYKLGDTLTIADAPTPPDGKTFVGWKDNNSVLHTPGENLLFTDWSIVGSVSGADAILLTADYIDTPKNDASKHVITFDTDGGTAIAPIVLDTGAVVNPPQDPTKTGYKFDKWSPELPETMPDADLTVKALWNAEQYTITFVTHSAAEIDPITEAYGATVTAPADPSRDNYDFGGWTPELPATMPAKNLTVEAVWEPKTYTITFDTNGGNEIDPFMGIYGARVTVPENPVRVGYTFNGWNPEIPHYMPAENLTVTAQWVSSTASGGTPSTGGETTTTPTTPSTPSTGGGGGGSSGGGGGGGTPGTYKVTVVKVSGGKAKASPTRAQDGVKITVTASPDKNYTLDTLTVKANSGADVAVTQGADGSYTFVMPKSDVTVTPDFVKLSGSSTPSSQDSETDGGTPGIPVTPDGSIVPDDNGDTSTPDTPGDTDDNGEPVPVPPDKTGVSDWLVTDAHPSYINGFTDGTFRPYASITRAQTAMMFYRLLKNKSVPHTVTYRDMSGKEWYAEAVYTLSYYGIIQGYSDGDFHGDRSITRAAFTAIAARFAKHIGEYKDGALRFSDVPETHWARDVITGAASCGWIAGYDDGTFRPANSITRAAATAIINRMLARTADKAYVKEHFGSLKPFSDVRDETAWYFYNVMEAANNHDFTVQENREVWNSVKN